MVDGTRPHTPDLFRISVRLLQALALIWSMNISAPVKRVTASQKDNNQLYMPMVMKEPLEKIGTPPLPPTTTPAWDIGEPPIPQSGH